MRRRKKHEQKAEINVVPWIDVCLVLLIVFMVTAPLLMQGVEVQLPQASTEPMDTQEEPLIVSVKQDKTFYINLGADQNAAQPLTAIAEQVQKVRVNKPKTPVLVWGDARVDYGTVVEVMGALQAVGVENVGLVTEPPSSAPAKK
ncbi:MAG: protein TolR [Cellvibrionales bacterium]|nr:MAG: protein TolR [Cellvibrionales bacterium]HRG49972.1 protein TolR [Pseudomonadales bacterium]